MTGLDFIKGALRLIRALDSGEEPEAAEAADALQIANDMLGAWSLQRLAVFHFQTESIAWPAATASRTIGAGGQLATTRPTRIEAANWVDAAGLSSPLTPINAQQYQGIVSKTDQGTPDRIFLDTAYPLASLYLYAVPGAAGTLNLTTWQQFTAMTLAAQYALPPGYALAVRYNLAVLLAPEYGRTAPPDVREIAASSLDLIKTVNLQIPQIETDLDGYGSNGFNLLAGG